MPRPDCGDAVVERAYLVVMLSPTGAGSERGIAASLATCLGFASRVA